MGAKIKALYKKLRNLFYSRPIYRQFFLYAIIGTISSLLDFCVFKLLTYFGGMEELYANLISVPCGMICSFFLNYFVNFKSKGKFWLRLISFLIVGTIGLGFSELFIHLGTNTFSLNADLTKLSSIVLVALLQFGLNKFITFKEA